MGAVFALFVSMSFFNGGDDASADNTYYAKMSFRVFGNTADPPAPLLCGAGPVSRDCGDVPAGPEFSIEINADVIPVEGYTVYQAVVQYSTNLTLIQQPDRTENIWPAADCNRIGSGEVKGVGHYELTCKAEFLSNHVGPIADLHFKCPKAGGMARVDLIGGTTLDSSFFFRPNIGGNIVWLKSVPKAPKVVADSIIFNCDPDTDGDGCFNYREIMPKAQATSGGGRDGFNYWDFFNTPNPNASPQRDNAINLDDILRVATRFGTTGNPLDDPLSTPPKTGYHPAYDRGDQIGANYWQLAPADGAIDLDDVFAIVDQFGTFCKVKSTGT
jgi:hypothetical protein